jgi:hypothetical protein
MPRANPPLRPPRENSVWRIGLRTTPNNFVLEQPNIYNGNCPFLSEWTLMQVLKLRTPVHAVNKN